MDFDSMHFQIPGAAPDRRLYKGTRYCLRHLASDLLAMYAYCYFHKTRRWPIIGELNMIVHVSLFKNCPTLRA